eukprot:1374550-Amorphochlora_amoeboformis.AAC.1
MIGRKKTYPQAEQDSVNGRVKRRSGGASCHQCKKSNKIVIRCTNLVSKNMQLPRCRLKFCTRCLVRFYANIDFRTDGTCPVCRGICKCAACVRTRKQREKPTSHKKVAESQSSPQKTLKC